MQPSVVYPGAEVSFWVDPLSSMDVVKAGKEWPIKEARINGYTIDFEGYLDETSTLGSSGKNQIRGRVGDRVKANSSAEANVRFKVGDCVNYDITLLKCDYTNTSCYRSRVLPVINSVTSSLGYKTGG